jgi:cyclopropane fatty-acyl-phospholipid synthase-like methyltransferase
MNQAASSVNVELQQKTAPSVASQHNETGATHGLGVIFWILEQSRVVLALIPLFLAVIFTLCVNGGLLTFLISAIAIPFALGGPPLAYLIWRSRRDTAETADWSPYLTWKDEKDAAAWKGKKIPMETLYEAYMAQELEFDEDVYEVLLKRNKLFRFCFTRNDIMFYLKDFLGQNTGHSVAKDEGDIAHVYNRGNDFYNWFLGETMIYTSGIFRDREETIETAQQRKLEMVCKTVQMKEGERHLDIGCGWGTLAVHSAKDHNTHVTGVTLAQEQADWANNLATEAGVRDRVNIIVDDYRNLPAQKWDKITCLEMAEHVGIKNFQKFLLQVRAMLEDDGIFYLQIAGLRRAWQFEDLVWGLFMGKYIFPGADASCPLGFVVSQAERAGFEIHRVENCGVHYSLTIHKWYLNWKSNEEAIVAKYGERWFRMWMIFLAWSAIIAAQGSSTVFMLTMAKNIENDKDSVDSNDAGEVAYSRTERWVGPDPVSTQQ